MVGMDWMPKRPPSSGTSSVLTLATIQRPRCGRRDLRQLGRHHAAGSAPGRPEIHHHGKRRRGDQGIEDGRAPHLHRSVGGRKRGVALPALHRGAQPVEGDAVGLTAGRALSPARHARRLAYPKPTRSQYLGMFGSISAAHRSIPPARLRTWRNPASWRSFTAFALRPPHLAVHDDLVRGRQRFRFCGSVPSGIFTEPGSEQIAISCGSRTSSSTKSVAAVAHRLQLLHRDLAGMPLIGFLAASCGIPQNCS